MSSSDDLDNLGAARMSHLWKLAAAARQALSIVEVQASSRSNLVAARLEQKHAARQPASTAPTQVQVTGEVIEELEVWIKARTTTAQDRSCQAASGRATVASCWGDTVSLLKEVPAAAANGATGQQLHSAGLTCLRECTLASNICPLKLANQKHLVDDLKLPLHLAKAISCLLLIPEVHHVGAELCRHLSGLLAWLGKPSGTTAGAPPPPAAAQRIVITAATQIAASGLLQQLPEALLQAEQRLQRMSPHGHCDSIPCKYCLRDCLMPPGSGMAYVQPPATALLNPTTVLLAFWPGSVANSAAVGPLFIPAAQTALSTIQHASRRVETDCQHDDAAQHYVLDQLGSAALAACMSLCKVAGPAASSVTGTDTYEKDVAAGGPIQPCTRGLVSHPAMMSAAIAAVSAGMYGQQVCTALDSQATQSSSSSADATAHREPAAASTAAFAPDASAQHTITEFSPAESSTMRAWQLLSAREASLQPGEMLLPKLQQQLMQALGCHSKGFLRLAAVWIGEQRQMSADVDSLVLRAITCTFKLTHVLTSRKGEEQQQQVAPEQVQQ